MSHPWVFVATAMKSAKRLKLKRERTKGFNKLSHRLASYMIYARKAENLRRVINWHRRHI